MRIIFFSNFLNHHQLPFCLEMVKLLGNNFSFVATEKIPQDRIDLGYEDMNDKYNFVIKEYEHKENIIDLIRNSDAIILGSAPSKYLKIAIKEKKICFRYSERTFRDKGLSINGIKHFCSILLLKTILEKKVYVLCSSAYTTRDYNIAGAYINRCYKWGYFPSVKKYNNITELIEKKEPYSIIWVARFIDVKHPEAVIYLAKKLKEKGLKFSIKMIGIGELKEKIEKDIKRYNLDNNIVLLGSMSPEKVRQYMEKSSIFIFTSDKGEGWGAVLNEAMNSGCAVVANHSIGSVPFLLKDDINGKIYKDGDLDDLTNKVEYLLKNKKECAKFGKKSYETMINLWNPSIAASRLIELINHLNKTKEQFLKYNDGPCSKADFLKNNWYK